MDDRKGQATHDRLYRLGQEKLRNKAMKEYKT